MSPRRLALATLLGTTCGDDPGEPDILAALGEVDGLEVEEATSPVEGYRFFRLEYEQPADHDDPEGPRFRQRMTLLHRDVDAPLVMVTAGYSIAPDRTKLGELAELLDANQLQVEHRFFATSRPDPADWATLTIEQAATDHHRVAVALQALYSGPWLSTGASKSGMAAVYFRRFYPDDVAGTVAYVAPNSLGIADPRYLAYFEQIGDPTCQDALKDIQREVLLRRPAILARMQDQAASEEFSYAILGEDRALETATLELPFIFWQYSSDDLCPEIPPPDASDDEVWGFLDTINPPALWSDDWVLAYEPYFWQAAVELGYPAVDESNVADLLMYPGLDVPETYVVPGPGKEPAFDPQAMLDVAGWLASEGRSMLFIYGDQDPYTAAAFELGDAEDSYRFIAAGKNHGARIADLAAPDRELALSALAAWTKASPTPTARIHSSPEHDRKPGR